MQSPREIADLIHGPAGERTQLARMLAGILDAPALGHGSQTYKQRSQKLSSFVMQFTRDVLALGFLGSHHAAKNFTTHLRRSLEFGDAVALCYVVENGQP